MMQIDGVWVLTEKVNGPQGHGEPGQEYIALASVAGAYEKPMPSPAFLSEEDALAFAKKQDKWHLPREAIFLPIMG